MDSQLTIEKRIKKCTIFGLCLLFIWGITGGARSAISETDEKNSFQFTMEARLPENQIDPSKTYFDLRVEPGQVQDLQVDVINLTSQPLTLQVYATTAITNNNGEIDYSVIDPKLNPTLLHPFSEIAQVVNPEVTLAAQEKKVVNIQLSVPEQPFNGEILGGIFVVPKEQEGDHSGKVKSKISTQQTMVKGVRLTENDELVTPKLEMLEAHAGQIGYRNVFQAVLQNSEPVIVENLDVKAAVYKKGDLEQSLYENESKHLRMAPNSSFSYSVPLNSALFTPGNYVMKLTATSGDQKWEFEQALNVSVVEAERLNKQIPKEFLHLSESKKGFWWSGFAILFIIFFLLIIGIFFIPSWKRVMKKWRLVLLKKEDKAQIYKKEKISKGHKVKQRRKNDSNN